MCVLIVYDLVVLLVVGKECLGCVCVCVCVFVCMYIVYVYWCCVAYVVFIVLVLSRRYKALSA